MADEAGWSDAHGVEAGERISSRRVGRVQRRAADDPADGNGLAHASAARQGLARVAPRAGNELCRPDVHSMPAVVHAPVLARLVRSSWPARRLRRLFPQLPAGDAGAAAMVHRRIEQALRHLRPECMGHYRLGWPNAHRPGVAN